MPFNRLAEMRAGVLLWLAAYGALWIVIPLASNSGLPADTVEIVAWGREWLVGLYRHPPMKTWLMEIAFQTSGGWLGSAYVLSALAFAAAQLAIFAAIRDVRSRSVAFAAVVLSALIVYFGIHLPQWNANIAQLPFAALFMLGIWRGLDRGGAHWWLLAGLAAAGGFLSKYSFALIPVSVAVLVLYDPWMRSRVRWGPALLAVFLMLILLTPNALWLLNSPDVAEHSMAANDRLHMGGWLQRVLSPLSVIGVTLAVSILPAVAVLLGLKAEEAASDDGVRMAKLRALFGASLFGPLAAVVVIGIATGVMIKDHWLIANFLFIPGWLLLRLAGDRAKVTWSNRGAVFVVMATAIIASVYPLERLLYYRLAAEPVAWAPLLRADALADVVKAKWIEGLRAAGLPETTPIPVVGGNGWAAIVANVLPERPAWYEHLDPALSPWVSSDMLRRDGIVVVGPDDTASLRALGLCRMASTDYHFADTPDLDAMIAHIEVFLPTDDCPNG